MPVYEYTCKSCSKPFEHLQRTMTDGPRPKCPECGSGKTVRKMSVFAVTSSSGGRSEAVESAPGLCGRCGGPPGSCSA